MAEYLKANICARVRLNDEESLLVDKSTLRCGDGEDYWTTVRLVTDQPGALVAVWLTDNLLIEDWPTGPLDIEKARQWIDRVTPNRLLLRSEWNIFFEIPRYYTDEVRIPQGGVTQA